MARGIEIREAHFPGRAPIETYGNGGFRFADMSHRGSILCLPSGIHGWDMDATKPLSIENFQRVLAEAGDIEFLLVGTGVDMRPIPADLKAALKAAGHLFGSDEHGRRGAHIQHHAPGIPRRGRGIDRGLSMADMSLKNQDICLAMLRDSDRDRYLACLLSPPDKRGALAALYAFNAELARIRDLVHEPLPGEVRMQYWRDLLEGNAHGSTEANPVASALLSAIDVHRLPRQTLVDMIDARIFDLYDDPMETRVSLEGYAGETASALIQLASLVLVAGGGAKSAEAAGHAGVAQAIAGLLAADAAASPPRPGLYSA
jgi:uncharacterized protein